MLHDRDSIFVSHLDESIRKLGITVLKSPPRSPKANATCERVIGTIRRECLHPDEPKYPSGAVLIDMRPHLVRERGGEGSLVLAPR